MHTSFYFAFIRFVDRPPPPPPATVMEQVPVIDLSSNNNGDADAERFLVQAIAQACSTYGFFQVIGHGIPTELMNEFRSVGLAYFHAKTTTQRQRQQQQQDGDRTAADDDKDDDDDDERRNETNARGFFDDELTKQKRDWKMALDVGVPGSRDWDRTDNDPANACLDGYNKFPHTTLNNGDNNHRFRDVVVRYFTACTDLSDRLARLMAKGIVGAESHVEFVEDLRQRHTSYLRLNYYPPCAKDNELGISPHRDAGFLTVLLQDDDCHSLQVWHDETWHIVSPIPGALTINTGDMAQIWSNGIYTAPLHRVLTHAVTARFTAPYFYNPGYDTYVAPTTTTTGVAKYHPCLWGYFRALRFAGDLTDLGVEIQVSDYERVVDEKQQQQQQQHEPSVHLRRQAMIAKHLKWNEPFSVARLRTLLEETSSSSLSVSPDI